jgi:hypothetical protein
VPARYRVIADQSRFSRSAISSVSFGRDWSGARRSWVSFIGTAPDFRPIVRVDIPNENPPSVHDKSVRRSHGGSAVAYVLRVLLPVKILLGRPWRHAPPRRW